MQLHEEVGAARVRLAKLQGRGLSAVECARKMAAEFHVCIYAVKNQVWACYMPIVGLRPEYVHLG